VSEQASTGKRPMDRIIFEVRRGEESEWPIGHRLVVNLGNLWAGTYRVADVIPGDGDWMNVLLRLEQRIPPEVRPP